MTPLQLKLSKDQSSIEYLEENAIMILENKFGKEESFVSIEDDTTSILLEASPTKHNQAAAATIVDKALGDFRMITPPSSPTPMPMIQSSRRPIKKARPTKKAPRKFKKATPHSKKTKSKKKSSSCLVPTASDPADESFFTSLYSGSDVGKINPVHEVIRRDVLEVRRTISGRVFFQCACCKHLPRSDRAKLSSFSPQKVKTIYRSFVRFMMDHVSACEHIPDHIKDLDAKSSRNNKVTKVNEYWITSARKLGLKDTGKSISI